MISLGEPERNNDALPADALTVNFPVLLDGVEIGVIGFQLYSNGDLYVHGGFPEDQDRGHGYGKEAFRLLVDVLAGDPTANPQSELVHVLIRKDNAASLRLAEKLGFEVAVETEDGMKLIYRRPERI